MFEAYLRLPLAETDNDRWYISASDCYVQRKRESVVRLFCLNQATNMPRTIHIQRFRPYFFVKFNNNINEATIHQQLGSYLLTEFGPVPSLKPLKRKRHNDDDDDDDDNELESWVCSVRRDPARSIMHGLMRTESPLFFKVELLQHRHVTPAIQWLAKRFEGLEFFEGNVEYTMRFLIDKHLTSCGWFRMRPPPLTNGSDFYVEHTLIAPLDTPSDEMPPLRVLSFDLECTSVGGMFPRADVATDHVIQISVDVRVFKQGYPCVAACVLSLGKCSSDNNTKKLRSKTGVEFDVFDHYETEEELLMGFRDLVLAVDPDIYTGYNVVNFDWPYLLQRAKFLGLKKFAELGRVPGEAMQMRERTFQSRQSGARVNRSFDHCGGRSILDVLDWLQRCGKKRRSYSLNAVVEADLGETKEDVPHTLIPTLWRQSNETRARLASYNFYDSYLAQLLLDKYCILVQSLEISRACAIPLAWLYTRGQQIRVFYFMLMTLIDPAYVSYKYRLPSKVPEPWNDNNNDDNDKDDDDDDDDDKDDDDEGYEGAAVLDPVTGFYRDPVRIIVLDMLALYPNIMIEGNMSPDSYLVGDSLQAFIAKYGANKVRYSKAGHAFADSSVYVAVAPFFLKKLSTLRFMYKRRMKEAATAFLKAVYDGQQLTAKLMANSAYGFFGVPEKSGALLSCIPIAESVTANGKHNLETIKHRIETELDTSGLGGIALKRPMRVVYGDTDSVMIEADCADPNDAFKLGPLLADWVNKGLNKPLEIQFEKIYRNWILFKKKRYAGLYCLSDGVKELAEIEQLKNVDTDAARKKIVELKSRLPRLDAKGIETTRRDNCLLVPRLMTLCLDLICMKLDPEAAVRYVHSAVADLLMNRIDISELIISKSYSKPEEDYKGKQPHVELAKRMAKRDPATAPKLGSRVPYIIVAGLKNDKVCEMAEDPMWVLEHSIPINYDYYLERQLKRPLTRLFLYVLGDNLTEADVQRRLFQGEHMRHRVINSQPNPNGGLGRFIVRLPTCYKCSCKLTTTTTTTKGNGFCQACVEKAGGVNQLQLELSNSVEHAARVRQEVWDKCVRCVRYQPTTTTTTTTQPPKLLDIEDIPCVANDCKNFYRRRQVVKDYQAALTKFQSLANN